MQELSKENSNQIHCQNKKDTSLYFELALSFYVLNKYDEVPRLPQHSSSHEFEDFFQGIVEYLQRLRCVIKDTNTVRQLMHTFYRVAES